MTADHALSSYQQLFKLLPGMMLWQLGPATAAMRSHAAARIAAAGPPDQLAAALHTLAHASLLIDPVVHSSRTRGGPAAAEPAAGNAGAAGAGAGGAAGAAGAAGACFLPDWCHGPAAGIVREVVAAVTASAAVRKAHSSLRGLVGAGRGGDASTPVPAHAAGRGWGGLAAAAADAVDAAEAAAADVAAAAAGEAEGAQFQALFGGAHVACWDFLPLIKAALDQLERFAAFAAATGIPVGFFAAALPDGLPEPTKLHLYLPPQLIADQGLLLLAEAWLVLRQLSLTGEASTGGGSSSSDSSVAVVSDLLNQPLVSSWISSFMNKLNPKQIQTSRSHPGGSDAAASPANAAAALLDLLAWAPALVQVLPTEARTVWLHALLFPPPDGPAADDSDEEEDDVQLEVRREHRLEDSYAELLSLSPSQLRRQLAVQFVGEDAYGAGVLKEWLVQLCKVLFDPAAALFQPGAVDMLLQHPCPAAALQPDWHKYTRLAGRVVGLALRHRVPLGITLSSAFFKALQAAAAAAAAQHINSSAARQEPQLPDLPAWQLPHPWQAAAAAAKVAAACRRPRQQQQQQQLCQTQSAADAGRSCVVTAADGLDGGSSSHRAVRFVGQQWCSQPTLEDLAQLDPEIVPGLRSLLETAGAADHLDLTFTAAAAAGGGMLAQQQQQQQQQQGGSSGASGSSGATAAAAAAGEVELVPGGSDLAVTEANKGDFVAALAEHKLLGGCWQQVLWFYVGLVDVADPAAAALCRGRMLLPLDQPTFNAALCGSPAGLNVGEWQAATNACGTLTHERRTLEMFWQVVGELDDSQRRQLLRFWTGITHLPASGFRGLGHTLQVMGLAYDGQGTAAGGAAAGGAAAAGVAAAAGGGAAAGGAAGAQLTWRFVDAAAAGPAWPIVPHDLGTSAEDEAVPAAPGQQGAAAAQGGAAAAAALPQVQVTAAAGVGQGSGGSGGQGGVVAAGRPGVLQLPRAHTCFMQLLLPMSYSSAGQMREALLVALQHVDYFGRA